MAYYIKYNIEEREQLWKGEKENIPKEIVYLNIKDTMLEYFDVSNYTNLKQLIIESEKIISFNIQDLHNLEFIYIDCYKLQYFEAINLPNLKNLIIDENELTFFKFSKNTKFRKINNIC